MNADFQLMDGMNDDEALEYMRMIITKMLISHKFKDKEFYSELFKSVGCLVNCELMWQDKYENDQALMSYFGSRVN